MSNVFVNIFSKQISKIKSRHPFQSTMPDDFILFFNTQKYHSSSFDLLLSTFNKYHSNYFVKTGQYTVHTVKNVNQLYKDTWKC